MIAPHVRAAVALAFLFSVLGPTSALATPPDPKATFMPADASSKGTWKESGKRGETLFIPKAPKAMSLVKGAGLTGVPFSNGYASLGPWVHKEGGVRLEVRVPGLSGENANDFKKSEECLAKVLPKRFHDAAAVRTYRVQQLLTWHHHEDAASMQLVPTALHSEIPHQGGASKLRKGQSSPVTACALIK
jgi:hypothetical protein